MSAEPIAMQSVVAEAQSRRPQLRAYLTEKLSESKAESVHRDDASSVREGKTSDRGHDQSQSGSIQIQSLSKKLAAHLGTGEQPHLRWSLYLRCERLAEVHGEKFYLLVREALSAAKAARNPGHYFCRAITSKIREAGFLEVL